MLVHYRFIGLARHQVFGTKVPFVLQDRNADQVNQNVQQQFIEIAFSDSVFSVA